MKKKTIIASNIISQAAAADIAGVSRQAINGLKDKYDFFVGGKVDISSDAWQSYIHERDIRTGESAGNDIDMENVQTGAVIPVVKKIKKVKRPDGKKQSGKKIIQSHEMSERQKYALTGGVSPSRFNPSNLADVERLAKIQNLHLQMKIRLGELIEREMVERVIDIMSQVVQSHFVDMPRKVSGQLCKKLDRVGMEKTVEGILSPLIAKGISEMKKISLDSIEVKMLQEDNNLDHGEENND